MAPPQVRLIVARIHHTYLGRYRALVADGQAEHDRWLPVCAAARLAQQIEPEREGLLEMVGKG
jgi:hypothetical protein